MFGANGGAVAELPLIWGAIGAVAAAPGSALQRGGAGDAITNGAPSTARPNEFIVVTRAGILRDLYVWISVAFGAGVGVTYTVYVNEVATAITVNIQGAAQVNASDLVNAVAVVPGDRVALHCDRNPGAPGSVTHGASLGFAPS